MVRDLLTNQVAGGAVAMVLGVVLALITRSSGWHAQFQRSAWSHGVVGDLVAAGYADRNGHGLLYDFVEDLRLGSDAEEGSARKDAQRTVDRVELVSAMSPSRRAEALGCANHWAVSVGGFARSAASEKVPLRAFLQTYHLGVIREAALAEPLLIWERSSSPVPHTEASDEEWLWALSLRDLAVEYNWTAPWQRRAVSFTGDPTREVLRAPGWLLCTVGDAANIVRGFRITRSRYRRARRRAMRILRNAHGFIASSQ